MSAPDVDKLAALRDLSTESLEALLNGHYAFPNWDAAWFIGVDRNKRLEEFDRPPSWLHNIAIGWTKDEYALWGLQFLTYTPEAMRDTLMSLVPDPDFGIELLHEYGIDKATTSKAAVEGILEFGTEAVFASTVLEIANIHQTSLPVHVYRFDQVDTTDSSPFEGYAYHSIDNVFFNQLPAVTGDKAPSGFCETAQAHSQAWIDLAYGDHPWVAYGSKDGTGCQAMVFDGAQSGVTELNIERYQRLTSSTKRGEMFKTAGIRLLREKTNLRPDPNAPLG